MSSFVCYAMKYDKVVVDWQRWSCCLSSGYWLLWRGSGRGFTWPISFSRYSSSSAYSASAWYVHV